VLRDLSGHVTDINASTLSDEALARIRALDPSSLPAVTGSPRLGQLLAILASFCASD
jgi:ureidoglycolate lyase